MPGLIGKKIGMTSIYNDEGLNIPVTILEVGPCTVVTVRTDEKNGYGALQLAFGEKKEKRVTKPVAGQYKSAGIKPAQTLREFRNYDASEFKAGDVITLDIFNEGDKVKVSANSKGKGFQGVMKRHGFSGVGGRTHGQGDRERAPGSIGQSSYPSRVLKGTRMAGRTGGKSITALNLKVVKVVPEKNVLFIKGAVPGSINSIVEINK